MKLKTWTLFLALLSVILFGCKNEMEEYYKRPDTLKGSTWDVLETRGNYTIFLEAIKIAGFETLVKGRGLVTIMAPNDESFKKYLNENEYSSLAQIPIDELTRLIGFHLVDNAYTNDLFSNFQPTGRKNPNPAEAGMYFKHKTLAKDSITKAFVKIRPIDTVKTEISIYHKNLFLPVLSGYIFDTKKIDATFNYEYLFSNSKWTGGTELFNISEASVTEYEIPADNGFVYLIDRVLNPLLTINESLKKEGEYSKFLSLYDRFSYYEEDVDATANYGNGEILYNHFHSELPNIAAEWPYNGELGPPDWAYWPALSGDGFSVFAPNNAALNNFFNEYWAPYYNSLDDVNLLPVAFLMYNHVYGGSIAFPEEIKNNKIITFFGTPVSFDLDNDVTKRQMCTNGIYYALNSVQTPPMFNSVTGPAFRDPKYRMFMFMLYKTGLYLTLSSSAINYTIFMPSDSVIKKSNYYDAGIEYVDLEPNVFGDESVSLIDGVSTPMGISQMSNYINSHVATDIITEIDGIKVYKTRNNFSYLYINGSTIASNKMFNENAGYSNMSLIDIPWTNGFCYDIDTAVLANNIDFKYILKSADELEYLNEYKEFSAKLTNAGLLDINLPLDFMYTNSMIFIPSNEVISNGVLPTDQDSLAEYLKYFFIPMNNNDLSDYAFPGAGIEGNFKTYKGYDITKPDSLSNPSVLTIIDNTTHLSLKTPGGQTAIVTTKLPKIFGDCAVYLIDALIEP